MQRWGEDEDGPKHRDCEKDPEEDPVQHLSHKLPVLNNLRDKQTQTELRTNHMWEQPVSFLNFKTHTLKHRLFF